MPSYTISEKRLLFLLSELKAAAGRGDVAASNCNAVAFVFGDLTANTLENQRGQASIQYILNSKDPLPNVFMVVSPSTTAILHSSDISISLASPIDTHSVLITSSENSWKETVKAHFTNKSIGAATKEFDIQEGALASRVVDFLRHGSGAQVTEAATTLGELLFVKDEAAQASVEKAAGLCSTVFRRYVRDLLERQLAKATPDTLNALREQLCEKLFQPNLINGLESLSSEDFSITAGLPTCIFNMEAFDAKIQVDTETLQALCTKKLSPDVINVRYGAKHLGYTAFIGRTLIAEQGAPSSAKEAYEFAFKVSEKVIELCIPGKLLKDVYREALAFATELNSTLAAHLSKSFGFSTGLLVLEARGTLSEKGTATVRDGMCFVVRVIVENLGEDGAKYNVEIADTVIVRNGSADLRTKVCRKVEDVVYEPVEEEEEADSGASPRDLSKITRQGASDTIIVSKEAQRDEELRRLLRELHAEFLANGGKKNNEHLTEELGVYEIGKLAYGELNPVSLKDIPEGQLEITVQKEKKVVWLPVYGSMCPFHICTVSKVDVKKEGEKYVMTITFHTLQEGNVGFRLNRTKGFLKELSYASKKDVFSDLKRSIQIIQQDIKNDDTSRKRNITSAPGGKLHLIPNALRLPQVKIRPPIVTGKRGQGCVGNLELHQNGLRFTFLGGSLEILFENVKQVIFQPAVNSILVCYHITLKKSIELGRKAVTEVQFIAEVMESSEAATGSRRTFEEEIHAEEREDARVRETNKQFVSFARAVEEVSKIRTQIPTNNFTFDGVHSKAMVTFKGSREVLWAVADWPAFTLPVAEVEVASLERIIAGNSTFDLTFIMKDYNKPVVTINSIPKKSLEMVKDWCLSVRLYYMETSVNPNWKVALKDIREDEEWQPWLPGTGWSVLNNDDDEEEEGEESESDSTYYEEEDEETDTSDDSWEEDEESSESAASESSGDESSADWDELDKKAQEHDRKRRYSDDDDDERPRKRAKPAPPATAAATRSSVPARSAAPPPRRF